MNSVSIAAVEGGTAHPETAEDTRAVGDDENRAH